MTPSSGSGSLAAWAIRRPVTTAMVFVALGFLGVLSWRGLPVQLLPDFALPQVYVQVIMPGASPDAVEEDALRVLEAELAGIAGIHELSSTALPGQGTVTLSFRRGVDLDFASVRVQQRVAAAVDRLPVQSFVDVQRFDTSTFSNFVMVLSFRGKSDLMTMRELAENTIVPALSGVDGVVQVTVQGGASKQIGIFVDPDRARGSGVSITDIQSAMGSLTRPVESVGTVEDGGRRLPVVLDGRARLLSDVTDAPVGQRATTRLGHVADVQPGIAGSVERYRVDGETSVGLYVFKDQQSNLIRVAHRLRERIREFNATAHGATRSIDFDAAERIETDLDELLDRALVGAGLALLVLLVFLRDLRPVLVVALAMPTSLLIGCALFKAADMSLNILSLLGLALSVGMLLDNAIVVLEAIAARREKGDSTVEAARRGTAQVQRAVLASTVTAVIVFVPLFHVETEMSPLFEELARSVSFPLIASLLVALTLIPVAAVRLQRRALAEPAVRKPGPHGLPRPDAARSAYSAVLRMALRAPFLTMLGFLGLVVLSVAFGLPLLLVFVDRERPAEDRIELHAELPEGSSIDAMDEVAKQLEELAGKLPEVDEIRTSVRETEADVSVVFKEATERSGSVHVGRARERLRKQAAGVERATIEVDRPPPQGAGGGGPDLFGAGGTRETVRVSGPGGEDLVALAQVVRDRLQQVQGIGSVTWDVDGSRPTLEVWPDRERLAEHGMSTAELVGVIWATRREGERARYPFRLGDEDVDLVLWTEGGNTRTVDDVRAFPLVTRTGARIPLEAVARVTTGSEPPAVRRWQRARTITITYGFTKEAQASAEIVEAAREEVDRAMDGIAPAGYYVDVEHATEELGPAKKVLYMGLALVFLSLAVAFESVVHPLLVMLCVPLAAIGVIWSLVLTGTSVNEFVMLALIVLLGVVVNHGILFVDRSQQLMAAGAPRPAAVVRAAHDRLRPILMTTATTVIGMLPLAVSGEGDSDLWPPFARAFIGGLTASTVISLVFIPAGALAFGSLGDLLSRLGIGLTVLATASWAALSWLVYFRWEIVSSELLQWMLAAPLWLGVVGLVRLAQAIVRGERPPDLVGEGPVVLSARNARKIYGGLPRPVREYCRVERWKDMARRAGMTPREMDPPAAAWRRLWWVAGLLALLVYLHVVAQSTWGHFLLALPVLALLAAAGRVAAGIAGRAGAWPPRGWVGRLVGPAMAVGTWLYLFLRAREGSAADIVTLVLAGNVLGAWALTHLLGLGGFMGLARRWFAPSPVVALAGVSLDFEDGLYGLLGPNGAGKSTLMRLVVNVFRASRGSITVNGHEVTANAASLQPRIGYLPQFSGVPGWLTARQYLHHQALLAGKTDRAERGALIDGVLHEVGLADRADEKLSGYSGGMRQRVGIARTLLNVPRIVVVDEPTVGLDPRERIRFRNLLAELAKTRVVLLSTHVVEDIGSSCREVVVLDRGVVLFRGTPSEMVERAEGKAWIADVAEASLAAFAREHRVVSSTRVAPGLVRARGVGPLPPGAAVMAPSLEDAYLLLLGRVPREVSSAA